MHMTGYREVQSPIGRSEDVAGSNHVPGSIWTSVDFTEVLRCNGEVDSAAGTGGEVDTVCPCFKPYAGSPIAGATRRGTSPCSRRINTLETS